MPLRALLVGTTLLYAVPALAAIDPPAASKSDGRIRSLVYDPNNVVQLYIQPGMSMRLEFGPDEKVVSGGIVVSDQDTISPDPTAPPPPPQSSNGETVIGANGAPRPPSTCDANLCRDVAGDGNIVYLKPVRPLDTQPLFMQTQRTNAFGNLEMVPYAFELHTVQPPAPPPEKDIQTASLDSDKKDVAAKPTQDKPVTTVWAVRFTYPERVKQQQAADWKQRQAAWSAQAHEKADLAHPVNDAPGADANFHYAWRGADAFRPDRIWDDGRSTYLRYDGNRRVPNVYSRLPAGEPTIPASWPQPDASGTTLKIAGTAAKWYVADGGKTDVPVGCVLNLGPDPEGRTSATVAAR